MLQDLDKIGLDFVDSSDDFVRIIEIPLFISHISPIVLFNHPLINLL